MNEPPITGRTMTYAFQQGDRVRYTGAHSRILNPRMIGEPGTIVGPVESFVTPAYQIDWDNPTLESIGWLETNLELINNHSLRSLWRQR